MPVGKTKDVGWNIGVSKTLPHAVDEVWHYITGEGIAHWLGEGVAHLPGKGEPYRTADGISGEGRSLREGDRVRLTWRPEGWTHDTTVQVAVTSAASGHGTVLRFHQERLADAGEREAQREYWRRAMERVEDGLTAA